MIKLFVTLFTIRRKTVKLNLEETVENGYCTVRDNVRVQKLRWRL